MTLETQNWKNNNCSGLPYLTVQHVLNEDNIVIRTVFVQNEREIVVEKEHPIGVCSTGKDEYNNLDVTAIRYWKPTRDGFIVMHHVYDDNECVNFQLIQTTSVYSNSADFEMSSPRVEGTNKINYPLDKCSLNHGDHSIRITTTMN